MNTVELIAIIIGLAGTLFNVILLWVIYRNRSIDRKCASIYKNIAVVDIFNCLIIPLCFLSLNESGYSIDLTSSKNTILYLLFGATVNIPYMLLILLSIARVMIFRHQIFYSRIIQSVLVRILCVLCWFLPIGGGLGIWFCFLLSGTATGNILIYLLKVQGLVTFLLIITTLLLISVTLALINQMISSNKGEFRPLLVTGQSFMESSQVTESKQILERELKSAQRTFSLFLLTILVFSLYPFAFSFSFLACGPYYNSTESVCKPLQRKFFSEPKRSYAITLISLCGMSLFNSLILLRQKSFLLTMKQIWIFRIKWQQIR